MNNSSDGLVEGIGQELTPASGPDSSPLKLQDGQWSFRFAPADPSKVVVLVTVNFGSPFVFTASSEMSRSQVEGLNDWLTGVRTAMQKSEGPAGASVKPAESV